MSGATKRADEQQQDETPEPATEPETPAPKNKADREESADSGFSFLDWLASPFDEPAKPEKKKAATAAE